MSIFFDENPEDGSVRFHHEAILGARLVPVDQSAAEAKAGKRPKMVENPACRIPEGAKPIDERRFEALMTAQRSGKAIVFKKGEPAAIDPVPDAEEQRLARRRERDRRLAASDWTQRIDVTISSDEVAAWADYRQELRDLDMAGSDWPAPPSNQNAGEPA